MYRIYDFLLAVRNQWGVASCVYGYSWFTRMSKGGVRQTTVDGLPPRLTVYRVATPWLTLEVVCGPGGRPQRAVDTGLGQTMVAA